MPQHFMYVWVIRNPFSFWHSARSKQWIQFGAFFLFLSLYVDVCFVLLRKIEEFTVRLSLTSFFPSQLMPSCTRKMCDKYFSIHSDPRESHRVEGKVKNKKKVHKSPKISIFKHICLIRGVQIFVYYIKTSKLKSVVFVRKSHNSNLSCKYFIRTIEYITRLVRWFFLMPTRYKMMQDKLLLKRQSPRINKMFSVET